MSQRRSSFRRELATKLEPLGWAFAGYTKGGHLVWRHPRVPTPLITAGTSTCRRGLENNAALARRMLRQAGAQPQTNQRSEAP